MVIDMHVLSGFMENRLFGGPMSDEELTYRQNVTGLYKTDELTVEGELAMMDFAGIDKCVLHPLDLTTISGGTVGTNEECAALVEDHPDRFIGLASVDPHRADAPDVLEKAFTELGLAGLKLHPSQQRFYPTDPELEPVYEMCLKYNKPIVFHSGMSAAPNTLVKYSHPLNFEEVALSHPDLRMCLAHFGWPWVREVAMLLLKYRNVYTDTAMLYFDNPKEFYAQSFGVDIGPYWIERSLRHQVMFGSEEPRLEQIRMIRAIREMDLRESTKDLILGGNALEFLSGGD